MPNNNSQHKNHKHHGRKKILFVLKQRNQVWNPDDCYAQELSSGLLNSVRFVTHMIGKHFGDCACELAQVVDGNAIDREVNRHKPHLVIIEALWVTPEKLKELAAKYDQTEWVVRLHSEVPFLANEGMALEWINQYVDIANVSLAANSRRLGRELCELLDIEVYHLPNCYEEF